MARKRSVSLPPDLDARIEQAAAAESTTFSGWLAEAARKEFTIRAGFAGVAAFELEHGALTPSERAEAAVWADSVLGIPPTNTTTKALRRRSA